MNRSIWSKWLLKYAAIPVGVILVLFLAWAVLKGPQGADICAGISLLLFIEVMIDLKRSEIKADRDVTRRIRAEYPAESQPQVFELYGRLKAKELEYLFLKVLDDAQGDLNEARKLSGLAESIGWKALLENRCEQGSEGHRRARCCVEDIERKELA